MNMRKIGCSLVGLLLMLAVAGGAWADSEDKRPTFTLLQGLIIKVQARLAEVKTKWAAAKKEARTNRVAAKKNETPTSQPHAVPEIDAGAGTTAIALLAGTLLLVSERRRCAKA
jgi:hypothetical protein